MTNQTKMHLNNKNNDSAGLITRMGFLLWRFAFAINLYLNKNDLIAIVTDALACSPSRLRKHLKTIRAVFWMLSPIILVLISRNSIVSNYCPGRDGGTRRKRPALMWPLGVKRACPRQFHQSILSGLKQMYKVVETGWCSHRILITWRLMQL